MACRWQVGEVVRGAYLAEAGTDVREAGDHRGPGGHQVHSERGHSEGGEDENPYVESKKAEDALDHLVRDGLLVDLQEPYPPRVDEP